MLVPEVTGMIENIIRRQVKVLPSSNLRMKDGRLCGTKCKTIGAACYRPVKCCQLGIDLVPVLDKVLA